MSRASDWLKAHASGAPDALREHMSAALAGEAETQVSEADEAGGQVPEALAEAALTQLATMLQAPSPRGAAIGLLAADALLTAAFEAAADAPDSIQQLAHRYDPARLAALLES